MAVMMTVAMPVWKQMSTREKEAELVFRGEQYARAIVLFQRKYANAAPPNIDVLVEQRFLRKKYKDPITNDDFVPIVQGQNAPGTTADGRASATPGGQTTLGGPTTSGMTPPAPSGTLSGSPTATGAPLGASGTAGGISGGIMGVTSKSKEKSIRLYKGRSHYNEWQFVATQQSAAPGGGVPAPGGQRGPGPGRAGQPPSPRPFGSPSPTFPGRGGRGGRGDR
jgi:type II secretory pathway pseudopilin PulG